MGLRNLLYDHKMLKATGFRIPVIVVGNLSTGGTGKTPHIEYLIRLLKDQFKVATLSRGYGRKTSGYLLVNGLSTATMVGDEPMQYHTKFKDILVAVGEKRADAIDNLLRTESKPEVVLLDDAFQHRAVNAGVNILLMEYDKVMDVDYPLPSGNLREWKSGMKRADVIIITKSPAILVPIERKRIFEHIEPASNQLIYFTYYKYGDFTKLTGKQNMMLMSSSYYLEKRFTILLVTGIASPAGMIEYLRRHTDKLEVITFADHHQYSVRDIKKIQETFDNIANANKIILTTEKDAMRFKNPELEESIRSLPLFYLPIEVIFHPDLNRDQLKFDQYIIDYVRKNQPHRLVHQSTN